MSPLCRVGAQVSRMYPRMSALWIYSFPAFPTINYIVATTGIIDRTRFRWGTRQKKEKKKRAWLAGWPTSQVPMGGLV